MSAAKETYDPGLRVLDGGNGDEQAATDLIIAGMDSLVEELYSREGGWVESYVHPDAILKEEASVNEKWVTSLARQMRDIKEADGGTGQAEAITLARIEGEPLLRIVD